MSTPLKAISVLTALASLAVAHATAPKPNILLIVGDDMGYGDVGFHGCKDIPTPHLDDLAASGRRFTNGYVTGPYCSPTRAALLTGRSQNRFGHEFNPTGPHGLPTTETILPQHLKSAGYATGLIGKWHLGAEPAMQPLQRGFNEFFGFLGGAHSYINTAGLLRGNSPARQTEYTTDAFGREAASFIERHKSQPWFLFLSFNAVHTPLQATDDRLARFQNIPDKTRRTYAAMMLALDDAVGAVRKQLVKSGLENNTLVFFISDNGGPTMPGVTVNGSINTPLRGSKRTTLEGGIRVPFVISWPGHVTPGGSDTPVTQLDLHTTALAAAGITADPAWRLEGIDLLPHLTSDATATSTRSLFWRFGKQMAVRFGDFKLVRYDMNADTDTPSRGISPPRLYNLKEDIGEAHDLATQMPERVAQLQGQWDEWNKANVPPLWGASGGDSDGGEPGLPRKKHPRKP